LEEIIVQIRVKCYESLGSFSSFLWTAYALLFL
jgi:hypothetical protein